MVCLRDWAEFWRDYLRVLMCLSKSINLAERQFFNLWLRDIFCPAWIMSWGCLQITGDSRREHALFHRQHYFTTSYYCNMTVLMKTWYLYEAFDFSKRSDGSTVAQNTHRSNLVALSVLIYEHGMWRLEGCTGLEGQHGGTLLSVLTQPREHASLPMAWARTYTAPRQPARFSGPSQSGPIQAIPAAMAFLGASIGFYNDFSI